MTESHKKCTESTICSGSKRQPEDKLSVLYLKTADTTVPLYNGTDTLHANAMSGLIRHRDSVFKADVFSAGILHLPIPSFSARPTKAERMIFAASFSQ